MSGPDKSIISSIIDSAGDVLVSLAEISRRQQELNHLYVVPGADSLIAKCNRLAEESEAMAAVSNQEVQTILGSDRRQRALNTAAMAATCAAVCGAWGAYAAAGSSTTAVATATSLNSAEALFMAGVQQGAKRFAVGVGRNLVVQAFLQSGDAAMNYSLTGSTQKSLSGTGPFVMMNAMIAGALPAWQAADGMKLFIHGIRGELLIAAGDAIKNRKNMTVLEAMKAIGEDEVAKQLPAVKKILISALLDDSGQAAQKIYNDMVSTEILKATKDAAMNEVAKRVPQLNWMTVGKARDKAVYSDDIQDDLKELVRRIAARRVEASIFRTTAANILVLKKASQMVCDPASKITAQQVMNGA
ncbi:MAG: hypothetical protein AAF714_05360 [Pseudomonadota bacterium]